jgi:hypothetical protein
MQQQIPPYLCARPNAAQAVLTFEGLSMNQSEFFALKETKV